MRATKAAISPLEQFLTLPEFKPALELISGRVIQKMSPVFPQSVIQRELVAALNSFARPKKLGAAYPELRAVFGRSAQVPDVSFYLKGRLPRFVRGQEPPLIAIAPDITGEILSPGQSVKELRTKIRDAIKHGSKLGWLIDPIRETIGVLRPGRKIEVLKAGDLLIGDDVLPGFSLPIDEIFGWLDQD
jgi:Uma2 family endonuclease